MSNINTDNIDQAYPVAAQDNDSQGFRNNFTNIVAGLDVAKIEIGLLEDIAYPVAAPLTPQGVIGDKAGMVRADALYIYFCFEDWATTGGPTIWHRSAITPPAQITNWDA